MERIALPALPHDMAPGWLVERPERKRYEGVTSDERYRVKVPQHTMRTHKDYQRFSNGGKVPESMRSEFMRSDFWAQQKRLNRDPQVPREMQHPHNEIDDVTVQSWPPMAAPEQDAWAEDEEDRRFELDQE